MKSLTLQDIVPSVAILELKSGEKYVLRPVNVDDEIWFSRTFPGGIGEVLAQQHIEEICRAVFHQMETASQEKFAPIDAIEVNEDTGESRKIKVGGYRLLFHRLSGVEDKVGIYRALCESFGISRPILDEVQEQILKKKVPIQDLLQTGETSSISSPVNMDGPPSTSEPSPSEKSVGALIESSGAETKSASSKRPYTAQKSRKRANQATEKRN
jgi:hypothetical protein